jgi:hypothetical protein
MEELTKILMGSSKPIERKGKLFINGIEERVDASLEFIQTKYGNNEELELAIDYIEYFHSETIKADVEQLFKLGYYPSTETEMELDHSIKHALIGSYKSSFSDLRRALELTVTAAYLSSEEVDRQKAVDWIMSLKDTPGFSNVLSKLIKSGRYKDIEEKCGWKNNLQNLYWSLSDFSHNKGQLKGYRELNNTNFFTAGTSLPTIKKETLELFCDFYIQTVKEIVAVQSLYNPVILVGVPFEEKFGLEGPMSGYLNDGQAELINKLIPENYREYFDYLIEYDEEIKSVVEYFNSLPDLTEEDIKLQAKRQGEFFDEMKKNEPSP